MRLYLLVIFIALCVVVRPATGATNKYAVLLGNNKGHDSSKALRYAEKDARKMASILIELGGFDRDDVTLLEGEDADTALNALETIEHKIRERAQQGEKTLFLFYYSGHADGDVLELGDSSFPFAKLQDILRSSSADIRIAFVDSCESGRLITTKGGRRGPEFDIQVSDELNSSGYAIFTSSSHNELSQESQDIRGAVFTHYLVSALRGAGDKSGDGRVTLVEAYRYTYARTLARTSRTSVGGQHPMYDFALKGRGEVVLTNTGNSGSSLLVTSDSRSRLLVLDGEGESIVAESEIEAGRSALIAVSPGAYKAYLINDDGVVWEIAAEAGVGEQVDLNASEFTKVDLETPVRKGGLFKEGPGQIVHRLSLGGLWRRFPLEGAITSYGLSAGYRFQLPNHLEPILRANWATRNDVGLSTGYHDVGLQLGLGYVQNLSYFDLRAAVLLGVDYIFQDEYQGNSRGTPAFAYLGLLGAVVPIGQLDISLEVGAGARVFELLDTGIVHRFDAQAVLTFGWRWIE